MSGVIKEIRSLVVLPPASSPRIPPAPLPLGKPDTPDFLTGIAEPETKEAKSLPPVIKHQIHLRYLGLTIWTI